MIINTPLVKMMCLKKKFGVAVQKDPVCNNELFLSPQSTIKWSCRDSSIYIVCVYYWRHITRTLSILVQQKDGHHAGTNQRLRICCKNNVYQSCKVYQEL